MKSPTTKGTKITRVFGSILLLALRLLRGESVLGVALIGLAGAPAWAEVADVTIADVTTRAFSVVWASDMPVVDADVRVFTDADGLNEVTGSLEVDVVSVAVDSAHRSGIVKIDVRGVAPDTRYYVQTQTISDQGLVRHPIVPPFPEVLTAASNTSSDAGNDHIPSRLLVRDAWENDGTTPMTGALALVRIPELSRYPLTAFIPGTDLPVAIIDLTNLVDDVSGVNTAVTADTMVEIGVFRGLRCQDIDRQRAIHRRRLPADEPSRTSAVDVPRDCFAPDGVGADFDCDARIGAADFNLLLARMGSRDSADVLDCRYNVDFDLDADGDVDDADFDLLRSVIGAEE